MKVFSVNAPLTHMNCPPEIDLPITHICYTKELFPNQLSNHCRPHSMVGICVTTGVVPQLDLSPVMAKKRSRHATSIQAELSPVCHPNATSKCPLRGPIVTTPCWIKM